jgi:hypothetical protein
MNLDKTTLDLNFDMASRGPRCSEAAAKANRPNSCAKPRMFAGGEDVKLHSRTISPDEELDLSPRPPVPLQVGSRTQGLPPTSCDGDEGANKNSMPAGTRKQQAWTGIGTRMGRQRLGSSILALLPLKKLAPRARLVPTWGTMWANRILHMSRTASTGSGCHRWPQCLGARKPSVLSRLVCQRFFQDEGIDRPFTSGKYPSLARRDHRSASRLNKVT